MHPTIQADPTPSLPVEIEDDGKRPINVGVFVMFMFLMVALIGLKIYTDGVISHEVAKAVESFKDCICFSKSVLPYAS